MSLKKDIRSLTYSLDLQMPGIYFWCGNFIIQIGGTEVDDEPDEPYYYPFIVPTFIGFGIVLTNDLSWHTPFNQFKRIEENITKGLESRAFFGVQWGSDRFT